MIGRSSRRNGRMVLGALVASALVVCCGPAVSLAETSAVKPADLKVRKLEIRDNRGFVERSYDYLKSFFYPKQLELPSKGLSKQSGTGAVDTFLEKGGRKLELNKPAPNIVSGGSQFVWEKSFSAPTYVKTSATEADISSATYCDIVNPNPVTGSSPRVVGREVTLSWKVNSISGGNCSNLRYDVLMSPTNPPPTSARVATGLTTTEVTTPILANNVRHFWQVVATNTSTGFTESSQIFSFTPKNSPRIQLAGYLGTYAKKNDAGTISIIAVSTDPETKAVELAAGGAGTGVFLTSLGGGAFQLDIPYAAGDLAGLTDPLTLELIASDTATNVSSTKWPYLTADCVSPYPATPSTSFGEQLENKVADVAANNDFLKLINCTIAVGSSTTRAAGTEDGPRVYVAGYWDSAVSNKGSRSGLVHLVAYAASESGSTVNRVEVSLGGSKIGDMELNPNWLGVDGLWGYELNVGEGGLASLCGTNVTVDITAYDAAGRASDVWPYLTAH